MGLGMMVLLHKAGVRGRLGLTRDLQRPNNQMSEVMILKSVNAAVRECGRWGWPA